MLRKGRNSFIVDDKRLDFSDIPELTPDYLRTLKRVPPRGFYKVTPIKESCHIMLDKDVLDFFGKGKVKGYQTRINEALREYMSEHLNGYHA